MNKAEIREVLDDVQFTDYHFHVAGAYRHYIQASFLAPDAHSGQPELQYTRKWYISDEATKSEVVQTCLKLVLTSLEHEARESFKYKGAAIFGPHLDVDVLLSMANSLDRREVTA